MMTNLCVTSEKRTITPFDAR